LPRPRREHCPPHLTQRLLGSSPKIVEFAFSYPLCSHTQWTLLNDSSQSRDSRCLPLYQLHFTMKPLLIGIERASESCMVLCLNERNSDYKASLMLHNRFSLHIRPVIRKPEQSNIYIKVAFISFCSRT